jgi:hypothetical protein
MYRVIIAATIGASSKGSASSSVTDEMIQKGRLRRAVNAKKRTMPFVVELAPVIVHLFASTAPCENRSALHVCGRGEFG